jgi:hypothetical protein
MNWFYFNEAGEVVGPLSEETLRELHAIGRLAATTQVCREGSEDWTILAGALGTFTATPPPPPPVSHTPPPAVDTSGTNEQSFGSWYATKFGKMSGVKQALAWIFYGFLWIPVWWLISTQSHTSAAENSSGSGGHISNQVSSTNPAAMPTASKNRYSKPVLIGCIVALCVLAAIIGAGKKTASDNSHGNEAPPPSQPQPTQTQYPQLDSISVTQSSPCRRCRGTGQLKGQCKECYGGGTIMTKDADYGGLTISKPPMRLPCPQCRGSGSMAVPCPQCRGRGAE